MIYDGDIITKNEVSYGVRQLPTGEFEVDTSLVNSYDKDSGCSDYNYGTREEMETYLAGGIYEGNMYDDERSEDDEYEL